jgi:hypothetical protein
MFSDQQLRLTFDRYVQGVEESDNGGYVFKKNLEWYQVTTHDYPLANPWMEEIQGAIKKTGFEQLQIFLEYEMRLALKLYIEGTKKPENATDFFMKGLERYQIAAVCVPLTNPWKEEIRSVLRGLGFEKIQTLQKYDVWIR